MYRNNNRFSSRRGNNRSRSNNRRGNSNSIDLSKLVRKAVTTEVVTDIYVPAFKFEELDISVNLKENIRRKGFSVPTPIQGQAIPYILEGKDVVGIANTGTGKTGAFVIPLLEKLTKNRNDNVLIIAPTRELAEQINNEIYALTRNLPIRSVLCVGGVNIGGQISKLRQDPNIIVGTPGRLLDLAKNRYLRLDTFSTIVLDEVDRMLDMGFLPDIKSIISMLPEVRHSLFFSATLTNQVENIMKLFVQDYVKVSVKTGDTSDKVDQDVIHVESHEEKLIKLEEMLGAEEFAKVIVFVRTKAGVEKLDNHLYKKGFKVNSIHGNKSQPKRKRALESFKNGSASILIATDVAARGLDVPNVSHVINYDMPDTYEDYVHRIGRTGRASQTGKAFTFVEGRKQY